MKQLLLPFKRKMTNRDGCWNCTNEGDCKTCLETELPRSKRRGQCNLYYNNWEGVSDAST